MVVISKHEKQNIDSENQWQNTIKEITVETLRGVIRKLTAPFLKYKLNNLLKKKYRNEIQLTKEFSKNGTVDCSVLVNRWNPLPKDFVPELVTFSNGKKIDKRIYAPLYQMFDAAKADGVFPKVVSGYRTSKEQQKLLNNKIEEYLMAGIDNKQAKEKAQRWVALPGTSEHQLGLAVDINENKWKSSSVEVYNWLQVNAHSFGFIYRYPSDKIEITGVINEPWHYRYVGIEAATEIYYQKICLEEYIIKNRKKLKN